MNRDLRLKLAFVFVGCLLGGLAAYGAATIMYAPKAGTTFENLEDLRRAMLTDSPNNSGTVPLRALLNPHPDDRIIYDLRPNLDVTFQGVNVRTNSCGMRSPERPLQKPPGTYRIALLGDSFVFGWGVEQPRIFAQRLEDILNERSAPGRKVEVLNFGIPGYSTFQEVALFKDRGIDFQPDAVLVYFIDNDFGMPFFVRDVFNPNQILPGASFSRLAWSHEDERVQQQKKQLESFNPARALGDLNEIARDRGIPVYLAINARGKWRKDLKRLRVEKEQPAIKVIPMLDELVHAIKVRGIDDRTLVLPNDPHPSASKHELLAEILAAPLLEAIQ